MSRRAAVVEESVEELRAAGIDAFGTTVDVRDWARCQAAVGDVVKHFGRIDFLINNAAGNFMVSAEGLTPGGFRYDETGEAESILQCVFLGRCRRR